MSDNSQPAQPLASPLPAVPAGRNTAFSITQLWSGQSVILFALAVCWLVFFNALLGEWQVNPQYSFGYVVPLLGAALIWKRWPDRPVAVPGASSIFTFLAIGLLLLELPLALVLEANPEWRLMYWAGGFQVIVLTFYFLHRWGGGGWVRHFAPPIVFMLIAVPWPMGFEQFIIQGLMRLVAALTVEVAGILNIPAIQHGNLIEVGTGIVGIDEACSGVRSLQSALMLSLFLGEMYRFSWLRRASLIAGSMLFVLLSNLCRTSFLVWTAANHGLKQMAAWHDTVGLVIMFIVLPCLMGLAWLMKPKTPPDLSPVDHPPQPALLTPRWIGVAILGWLVTVQLLTEGWYRAHESRLIPNTQWSVAWPVQSHDFVKTVVPENSLAILRCSDSEAGAWSDDEGNRWSAFLLRWSPGKNSEQLARGHRPDICFPAAGAQLVDDFGLVTVDANGVSIPFRHQTFETGSRISHVFYCLWSDRISPDESISPQIGTYASRIDAVLKGKRNLGQKVFEIVLQGPDSSDEAIATLKQELPALIHRS